MPVRCEPAARRVHRPHVRRRVPRSRGRRQGCRELAAPPGPDRVQAGRSRSPPQARGTRRPPPRHPMGDAEPAPAPSIMAERAPRHHPLRKHGRRTLLFRDVAALVWRRCGGFVIPWWPGRPGCGGIEGIRSCCRPGSSARAVHQGRLQGRPVGCAIPRRRPAGCAVPRRGPGVRSGAPRGRGRHGSLVAKWARRDHRPRGAKGGLTPSLAGPWPEPGNAANGGQPGQGWATGPTAGNVAKDGTTGRRWATWLRPGNLPWGRQPGRGRATSPGVGNLAKGGCPRADRPGRHAHGGGAVSPPAWAGAHGPRP